MNKKSIVIASVLKPVNDTRMYEKIALSLAKANKYDIKIIGFSAKSTVPAKHIQFYPIFNFNRLSWGRVIASITFFKTLKLIKPDLVIFNTHELIIPSILYKLFYGKKVIYDVRENHFRNILFTKSFPLIFRPILAMWVRAKEYILGPWIDHFFLAEKYYQNEIHFTKNRHIILENKAIKSEQNRPKLHEKNSKTELLFSGTLAESTGVFNAINLAKKLHKIEPVIRLKIIGYSPRKEVINRIKLEVENHEYISLIGGHILVDHERVIEEIISSDFGIISYPTNKSTINSTPTKLYEYLSHQLPLLVQKHHKWDGICKQYQAGISIDFNHCDVNLLLDEMKHQVFYPNGVGEDFFWNSEEEKLINFIQNFI